MRLAAVVCLLALACSVHGARKLRDAEQVGYQELGRRQAKRARRRVAAAVACIAHVKRRSSIRRLQLSEAIGPGQPDAGAVAVD